MQFGKKRLSQKKKTRKGLPKRPPVAIPVIAIEFDEIPESVQKRVAEILISKGLVSQPK